MTKPAPAPIVPLDFGPIDAVRTLVLWIKPWRVTALILTGAVVVRVIADLVQRMALKDLIEVGLKPLDSRATIAVVAVIACAVLLSTAAHLYRDMLQARLSALLTNDIRERYFHHLQNQSSAYFGRTKPNDLVARYSGDIGAVETAFAAVMSIVSAGVAILFAVGTLAFLDGRLTLVGIVALPFMIAGPRFLAPRAVARGHEVKREQRLASNTLNEALVAHHVVRAYQLGGSVSAEFRKHLSRLRPILIRFNMLTAFAERTPAISLQIATIAVLATGSWFVFGGTLSIGALVAYHAVLLTLSVGVREMAATVPVLIRTAVSVRRIKEILHAPIDVAEAPDATPLAPLSNEMRMRGVQFGYTKDRIVLQVPELSIRAGTSVAFVGASGSGKSTALNLLIRFYDPTHGEVTFDGTDLRRVTKASLYAQMAVVFQDGFLFETTIRDNIRVGRPGATDADVEAAARAAEVHDAILALPGGYDTQVLRFGKSLSGGERQRIALARALLRDPRILILDEATSALDPATETSVQATLDRVRAGRTMVSVTHRVSAAMSADRIVVFAEGRVVEEGRHDELIAKAGVYAALWDKQTGVSLTADGDDGNVRPEWLRRISIFRDLDDARLTEAAARFVIERVPAGRTVITRGDPGERFYVVAHGTVAVLTPGDDGEDRQVAELREGDYFGEIALIRRVPRTATVTTVTDCVFATLHGNEFRRLVELSPGVRQRLESGMGARLDDDITGPIEIVMPLPATPADQPK